MTEENVTHPILDEKRRTWLLPALADFECEHGRLAGDPTEPCGCWPTEEEAA